MAKSASEIGLFLNKLFGEESPLQLHFLGYNVWVFISSVGVAQKLAALGNMRVWAKQHSSIVASSLWLLHQGCCKRPVATSATVVGPCCSCSCSCCSSSGLPQAFPPLPRARVIVSLLRMLAHF